MTTWVRHTYDKKPPELLYLTTAATFTLGIIHTFFIALAYTGEMKIKPPIPLALTLLSLLAIFANTANSQTRSSVGDVYEVESGTLIYREFHTFSSEPGNEFMQTQYKAPTGELLAERAVDFNNGYASAYVFKQLEPLTVKQVTRNDEGIEYKEVNGDKVKNHSFTVKNLNKAVVNAGMFNAVQRAWPQLINGEATLIDIVVPNRKRAFTMELKAVDVTTTNMAKYLATDSLIAFKLRLKSRLLRLIVPPIELGYNKNSKRLVFYHGPSNILKSNGKPYKKIRVLYTNSE